MKKLIVFSSALVLSLGMVQAGNSDPVPPPDEQTLRLDKLVDKIFMSVQGLGLITFNTAINTATIDGSVMIQSGGNLKSTFPGESGTGEGLKTLSEVLESFANRITTSANGDLTIGKIDITTGTESFTHHNNSSLFFDFSNYGNHPDDEFKAYSEGAENVNSLGTLQEIGSNMSATELTDHVSSNSSLVKKIGFETSYKTDRTGLIGGIIVFNAAINAGDINASVRIGNGDCEDKNLKNSTINISNLHITTQAIGAYVAGVVNVGVLGGSVK